MKCTVLETVSVMEAFDAAGVRVWKSLPSNLWKKHTHDRFITICPGLPGWAGTRRNIHPLTPLVLINHPYQLPPSTTNHSIIPAQSTYLAIVSRPYAGLCIVLDVDRPVDGTRFDLMISQPQGELLPSISVWLDLVLLSESRCKGNNDHSVRSRNGWRKTKRHH